MNKILVLLLVIYIFSGCQSLDKTVQEPALTNNTLESEAPESPLIPILLIDSDEEEVPIVIIHEPEISFLGITRQSLGRTMVFVFSWEVNNINDFDLDICEFHYNIIINNTLWADEREENLPRITANSSATIPITVSVSEPRIIAELVNVLNQGALVNYNNTGTMSFLSDIPGLDLLEMPLDFQGSTRIR